MTQLSLDQLLVKYQMSVFPHNPWAAEIESPWAGEGVIRGEGKTPLKAVIDCLKRYQEKK